MCKYCELSRRLRNRDWERGEGEEFAFDIWQFAFDMRSGQTLADWNISICFQHTWCLKTLKQMVIGWVGGWVGGGCVSDDTRWHRKHRWATDRCQWSQRCWVEMSNLVLLLKKSKTSGIQTWWNGRIWEILPILVLFGQFSSGTCSRPNHL